MIQKEENCIINYLESIMQTRLKTIGIMKSIQWKLLEIFI